MEQHDPCGCCAHDHCRIEKPTAIRNELLLLIISGALFGLAFLLSPLYRPYALLLVYLLLGARVIYNAIRNIFSGSFFDEQFLMSAATIGALCLGDFAEAAAVMLFYRVGELLQASAISSSRKRIAQTSDLRPDQAHVLRGDRELTVAPEQVEIGETILVKPGERIPLDGIVSEGNSFLDVSALTGEPMPAPAKPGTEVSAGAINTISTLKITTIRTAEDSATSRLLRSIDEATANKPRIQRFITKFSKVYTPCVIAMAILLIAIPPLLGLGAFSVWLKRGLIFMVISCPCALVLSIPLTFFAGLSVSAKNGALFKGADALEALSSVKVAVLDKTGTLTKGEFKIQSIFAVDQDTEGLLRNAAALEQDSPHPIAQAIRAAARDLPLPEAKQIREFAGQGVSGIVGGKNVLAGNAKLLLNHGVEVPDASGIHIAIEGAYAGTIVVGDSVREGAKEAVLELNKLVGETVILTGDHPQSAEPIARELRASAVYASLSPEQKLAILRNIQETSGSALFVGDGINDGPVLAGADVGVAMGVQGTDMAVNAADVILYTNHLAILPKAVKTARRTMKTAKMNIVIALAIKALAMALSAAGLAGMWIAVVADVGAAMLCVLNSLRLLRMN